MLLCRSMPWVILKNVSIGSATSVDIASKCLWGVIKTHIWAGRSHKHTLGYTFSCVPSRNIFRGSQENNWGTVRAFLCFHIDPRRAITPRRARHADSGSIIALKPIHIALSCQLLCLYQSELRNWFKLFGFPFSLSGVTAQRRPRG